MLMLQKAFAEGLRAMVLWTAHVQDQVAMRGGHGNQEARPLDALNDFMLPLIKGYGSEKVYELLAVSLQCFGGSGYCQDYPIEQYIRDQKIDSLYEGTTHIQALDLFFRKIGRDHGATLQALRRSDPRDGRRAARGARAVEKAAMQTAVGDVQAIMGAMMAKLGQSIYHVGLQGNRILFALAELVIGWRLVCQRAGRGEEAAGRHGRRRGVLPGQARGGAVLREDRAAGHRPGAQAGRSRATSISWSCRTTAGDVGDAVLRDGRSRRTSSSTRS